MRYIQGDDKIFEEMISGEREFVFNLFFLIRQTEGALLVTDDKNYIIAQSNSNTPLWIYLNKVPEVHTENEIVSIILQQVKKNQNLSINAEEQYIMGILKKLKMDNGINIQSRMKMNVYACFGVREMEKLGKKIKPEQGHNLIIAKLAQEFCEDAEGYKLSDEDAICFADEMMNAETFYLWEDKNVVAMANIAHKTHKYARINTVATERKSRGKGYARMLVGEMTETLLKSGVIPMLMADASNPSSNKAYMAIGYQKQGEITEFSCIELK